VGDAEDPRVYFAAERTLLAWVRTGLTVVGLGFVVARFGLFLRVLRGSAEGGSQLGSTLIGVGLVLLGSAALGMAAWQHVRFCRRLEPGSRPRPYLVNWSVWFAVTLAAVGVALAAYLLMRSVPAEPSASVTSMHIQKGESTCNVSKPSVIDQGAGAGASYS
jgi:putative membrane protein